LLDPLHNHLALVNTANLDFIKVDMSAAFKLTLLAMVKKWYQKYMSIKIRETHNLEIGEHSLELVIQSHKRAKRLRMRCDPYLKKVYLTCPVYARPKDINKFFEISQDWLLQQLQNSVSRTEFKHGATIPILGVQYLIQHQASRATQIRLDDTILHVAGDESRIGAMIQKWLRFHALGVLKDKSHEMAQKIGKSVNNVKVRELKSLWGSCAADGSLTYSWRLVMAPAFVLDYICAHEVSHLKERNHGPRFWALVEEICPDYKTAKAWLRKEGKALFRYG
jgi:predicted metal-dependent hydrolase